MRFFTWASAIVGIIALFVAFGAFSNHPDVVYTYPTYLDGSTLPSGSRQGIATCPSVLASVSTAPQGINGEDGAPLAGTDFSSAFGPCSTADSHGQVTAFAAVGVAALMGIAFKALLAAEKRRTLHRIAIRDQPASVPPV